jgi:hypothetical protein
MALKLDFSANALRLLKLLLNLSFQVKGKIDFQTFSPRENEPEFWEKLTREKLTFQLFKNKQRPRAWQTPHSKSEFQTFLTAREQPEAWDLPQPKNDFPSFQKQSKTQHLAQKS